MNSSCDAVALLANALAPKYEIYRSPGGAAARFVGQCTLGSYVTLILRLPGEPSMQRAKQALALRALRWLTEGASLSWCVGKTFDVAPDGNFVQFQWLEQECDVLSEDES